MTYSSYLFLHLQIFQLPKRDTLKKMGKDMYFPCLLIRSYLKTKKKQKQYLVHDNDLTECCQNLLGNPKANQTL